MRGSNYADAVERLETAARAASALLTFCLESDGSMPVDFGALCLVVGSELDAAVLGLDDATAGGGNG